MNSTKRFFAGDGTSLLIRTAAGWLLIGAPTCRVSVMALGESCVVGSSFKVVGELGRRDTVSIPGTFGAPLGDSPKKNELMIEKVGLGVGWGVGR